jgi:hypothetical protein
MNPSQMDPNSNDELVISTAEADRTAEAKLARALERLSGEEVLAQGDAAWILQELWTAAADVAHLLCEAGDASA